MSTSRSRNLSSYVDDYWGAVLYFAVAVGCTLGGAHAAYEGYKQFHRINKNSIENRVSDDDSDDEYGNIRAITCFASGTLLACGGLSLLGLGTYLLFSDDQLENL